MVTVKVLYRLPDTLTLIGIPYQMRPGQSPRRLREAHHNFVPAAPGHYGPKQIDLSDWVYLGEPGWFGTMPKARQAEVIAFCEKHPDLIPKGPDEWIDIAAIGITLLLKDEHD